MDSVAGLTGQTIGKYRIVEHLGRGGMAEVYKGYQPSLDRYVALKLMHAFLAGDPDFIARFEREAKNVAALRHPNIIQVFDFDVHNGAPYMVMEFIEGGTLKSHIEDLNRAGTPLTLTDAIRIIREVGRALSYAHQRGMIHRDVKPANVLLETGNRVILTDFGIAKIITGPSFTMTGATVGTPAYMSPEQSLGRPGDHRSDIYALGVMLYQVATGQLPYEADTPLAVMLKHVNEPLPLPRTFQPDLPDGIERIILKSMAKSPDDRFQSAEEMLASLDDMGMATRLTIPPASMAAGADAHAATVAPAQPTMLGPRANLASPISTGAAASAAAAAAVGATQLHQAASTGATPVITGSGPALTTGTLAPPPTPLEKPARRSALPLIGVIGVVLLLLTMVSAAFAFTRGFGLLPGPSATPTELIATTAAPTATEAAATSTVPPGTATPDLLATQFEAIGLTQAAFQVALATATPTVTPDLTATFEACTFAYALSEQDPQDGRTLTTGANTRKTLTITNTGDCAYPNGTMFTETVPATGLPPVQFAVPPVAPGEFTELFFDWPGLRQAGTMTRVFAMHLPGDILVGEPLTFTYRYALAATPRPLNTNTPVPPPASPTSSAAPLTDLYPLNYISCFYQGIDYRCSARLGHVGGTGPYTLYVNDQRIGQFATSESLVYDFVARRCKAIPYAIRLVDDGTISQIARDFYFDPTSDPGLFPGGACSET